jgi:hypothetical protein
MLEIVETEHASPTSEDICIARKRFKKGGLWEKLEGPECTKRCWDWRAFVTLSAQDINAIVAIGRDLAPVVSTTSRGSRTDAGAGPGPLPLSGRTLP